MSARDVLRAGFILLGVLLIVNSLSALAGTLTDRPLLVSSEGASLPALLRTTAVSLAVSAVGAATFGFIPGAVLIRRSRAWAASLLPDSQSQAEIRSSTLLMVGAVLLGLATSIYGAAGLAGAIVTLALWATTSPDIASRLTLETGVQLAATSTVTLVAGLMLYWWGRGMASGAA